MNITGVLSITADALLCLAYLVGIAAGVIALVRRQTRLGSLATAAFFLLGLAVVARDVLALVVLPALLKAGGTYITYSWLSFCIETPLFMIGVILLVVLIFTSIQKQAVQAAPEEEKVHPAQ
ncbi:MAG TPA: hypothetical protein VMC09_00070 [Anaerolineales bacterium]|nr:hypothetical protein [Anaerolineales bacterium]